MKIRQIVSVLFFSLLLISCSSSGGGGSSPTNDSSLVGTWMGHWSNDPDTDTFTFTSNTMTGSNTGTTCVTTWSYTANAGSMTTTVTGYSDAAICNNSAGAVGTVTAATYSISGSTLTMFVTATGPTDAFTGESCKNNANVTGTWTGSVSYTNASNENAALNGVIFAMTQSGTSVTGTWTFTGLGSTKTLSGSVCNTTLIATMADTACTPNSGSIAMDLTLSGNTLTVASFAPGSKVCDNNVQPSAVTALSGSLTKQ
jgi:hypothetical protein